MQRRRRHRHRHRCRHRLGGKAPGRSVRPCPLWKSLGVELGGDSVELCVQVAHPSDATAPRGQCGRRRGCTAPRGRRGRRRRGRRGRRRRRTAPRGVRGRRRIPGHRSAPRRSAGRGRRRLRGSAPRRRASHRGRRRRRSTGRRRSHRLRSHRRRTRRWRCRCHWKLVQLHRLGGDVHKRTVFAQHGELHSGLRVRAPEERHDVRHVLGWGLAELAGAKLDVEIAPCRAHDLL
mmetsp:Transcript_78213/g.224161  ORF Transcript_78213/g.224161 Transcript_78213/m.224161 type:complete len:233 (-) Transcript_78213:189-887(-)